jgi:hypothetical protein
MVAALQDYDFFSVLDLSLGLASEGDDEVLDFSAAAAFL